MSDEKTTGTPGADNPNYIPGDDKWTEIEHLPEWDEEFYCVYTAKKHGKWVMLKSLRPEYSESPEARKMIEQEFDVRYNLSHPAIVMINDFEDVPNVGRSIICDDVYGTSLRKLIDGKKVTDRHIHQLCTRLPSAMQYIQQNHIVHHPLRPETIIFTDKIENLKLIDVGFEQRPHLSPSDASHDIAAFGRIILEALDAMESPTENYAAVRHVAERAVKATPAHNPYPNISSLQVALESRKHDRLYLVIIAFLAVTIAILAFLIHGEKPGKQIPATVEEPQTELTTTDYGQ